MGTSNGSKKVKDLIGADAKIEWTGTKGSVTGTVNYIDNYGSQYSEGQKSGHFFPVKFPSECYNKNVTIGSQNGKGGKDIKPTAEDPYLIIRLENVTVADKISAILKDEGNKEIFELDFSKVTRMPELNPLTQEKDLGTKNGNKKVSDMIDTDVSVKWTGTKGEVAGKIKYNDNFSTLFGESEKSGHFYPMEFGKDYYGKNIVISGRKGDNRTITPSKDDPYLIQRIENLQDSKMTAKIDDKVIFELDFSKATLEHTGKDAVSIPSSFDYGVSCGNASDMCENVTVEWSGINGDVKGKFYKHKEYYQCPILIDKYFNGKPITVNVTTDTTDNTLAWHNFLSKDKEEAKSKHVTVKCEGTTLAVLSFTNATFEESKPKV